MSDFNTNTGAPCLSCKKRQVRCDGTLTACLRCQKDNITCPGYKKPLKWKQFRAPRQAGAKLQRIDSSTTEHSSVEPVRSNPSGDREIALVLDSVEYFNKYVVPYVSPAHLPFKRNFVPTEFWPLFPTVLKQVWIVICKTTQCGKASLDPILDKELCYYRGCSLSGLQKMLSDTNHTATDPYAAGLMSVLFIMGADMQLCEQHWTTHLEAGRQIIAWRGGLHKCLQSPATSTPPLINYLYADIITATACNAWLLNSRAIQSQFEYLSIIPNHEEQLISNGHPCPCQILQAITCTNILRAFIKRPFTAEERRSMALHPFDFDTIRSMIESFDPNMWASHISKLGRSLPQRAEDELSGISIACLASLAASFQSAAMLYLCISTGLEDYGSQTVLLAKHNLSLSLRSLFDNASTDHNGPLSGQLWRFTIWPTVVSGYAKAGWDIGEEGMEADLNRLATIMSVFSTGRQIDAVKLLQAVLERQTTLATGQVFTWDDGFAQRKAFVV